MKSRVQKINNIELVGWYFYQYKKTPELDNHISLISFRSKFTDMKRTALLFFSLFLTQTLTAQYFPGTWGDWETRTPEEMGFNADSISAVIEYAKANETTNPRSMEENHYGTFGREPLGMGLVRSKTGEIRPASLSKTDTSLPNGVNHFGWI